jgi:hypothetical protein
MFTPAIFDRIQLRAGASAGAVRTAAEGARRFGLGKALGPDFAACDVLGIRRGAGCASRSCFSTTSPT